MVVFTLTFSEVTDFSTGLVLYSHKSITIQARPGS